MIVRGEDFFMGSATTDTLQSPSGAGVRCEDIKAAAFDEGPAARARRAVSGYWLELMPASIATSSLLRPATRRTPLAPSEAAASILVIGNRRHRAITERCHRTPKSTLVVTKLDRLARSLPDARDIVEELTAAEVKLNIGWSLHDPNDPIGRLLFNLLAMIAEFESDLIRMRTDM